jgi:hypothetical protein
MLETPEGTKQRDEEFLAIHNSLCERDPFYKVMFNRTGPPRRVRMDDSQLRNMDLVYNKSILFSPKKFVKFINVGSPYFYKEKKSWFEKLVDWITGTVRVETIYPGGVKKWSRKKPFKFDHTKIKQVTEI